MQLKNNFWLVFFTLNIFLLVCCRNNNSHSNELNTIPEDYWEFYKMFHADSTYQLTHIVFPLEGLPADTEKKANESAYHWQKDDWILHKTFDYDQSFEREFRYFNGIVLEQIRNSTNHFLMERRFTKIQGEWHLIYYAAMRQVKNF